MAVPEPQDIIRGRKMRATGACVGALIGLVAITPAAGYVNIGAAFLFGVIGSVVCCGVLEAMERWGSRYVDDTLDVFAVHGVGECGCQGVCVGGGACLAYMGPFCAVVCLELCNAGAADMWMTPWTWLLCMALVSVGL